MLHHGPESGRPGGIRYIEHLVDEEILILYKSRLEWREVTGANERGLLPLKMNLHNCSPPISAHIPYHQDHTATCT